MLPRRTGVDALKIQQDAELRLFVKTESAETVFTLGRLWTCRRASQALCCTD